MCSTTSAPRHVCLWHMHSAWSWCGTQAAHGSNSRHWLCEKHHSWINDIRCTTPQFLGHNKYHSYSTEEGKEGEWLSPNVAVWLLSFALKGLVEQGYCQLGNSLIWADFTTPSQTCVSCMFNHCSKNHILKTVAHKCLWHLPFTATWVLWLFELLLFMLL